MSNTVELLPHDAHDQIVRRNVRPPQWHNPAPRPRYDLVVIGGGTAGLVSAGGAGLLGVKVALVEQALMGGDCLVSGCVPSKALIRCARAAAEVRAAGRFGVRVGGEVEVDFAAAMEYVRASRATVSAHDAAARIRDEFHVDVFFGAARFVAPDAVEVDGRRLNFARAVIATGGRPVLPPVPGLRESTWYTNETIFNLSERPRRLAVIGGGPLGCELAQALARLGSEVTLIDRGEHLLHREDPDAAATLQGVLRREGLSLLLRANVERVETRGDASRVHLKVGPDTLIVEADAILVGAGRRPNIEGLSLESAGVKYDEKGVKVNDHLRTTNRRVFAAGDVCLREKFTHTADASARIAVRNALLLPSERYDKLVIPWVTYTEPEIAHTGLYARDAAAKGVEVETYAVPLADVDRAITDGATAGFFKIHTRKGSDQVVGATIVANHAGEMISEITAAIVNGVGLKGLARVIHPYPTQAEAIRMIADQHFRRQRLTPATKWFVGKWLSVRH